MKALLRHLALLALITINVSAQEIDNTKIGIFLTYKTKDSVGERLVFNIRDESKKSTLFNVVDQMTADTGFSLNITTSDLFENSPELAGNFTFYSVEFLIHQNNFPLPFLILSLMGVSGHKEVNHTATSILGKIEKSIEQKQQEITSRLQNCIRLLAYDKGYFPTQKQ